METAAASEAVSSFHRRLVCITFKWCLCLNCSVQTIHGGAWTAHIELCVCISDMMVWACCAPDSVYSIIKRPRIQFRRKFNTLSSVSSC